MIGAGVTLLAVLAFAVGPFLVPDFDGFAPDRFPIPQEDPPVQPAGVAFAIWGLIYLWLVVGAAFGLWRRSDDPDWQGMRPALVLSFAIGAAWLPVAGQNPLLATAMIWAMWLTAVAALFRAPFADRAVAAWPIGLYAGWLSAACCVASGLCLAGYGYLSEEQAALVMVGLATVLAAMLQLKLARAPTFGLAVVWALAWIYVANAPRGNEVGGFAVAGAVAVGAITLFALIRERRPLNA